MIDIENDVINRVSRILENRFPGIAVSAEYIHKPSSLPAVTVVEANNVVRRSMRADRIENAADVTYDVQIYSGKIGEEKSEAKEIADVVDEIFAEGGFTRTLRQQLPNAYDASIFRLVLRYEGTVGREKNGEFLVYHN